MTAREDEEPAVSIWTDSRERYGLVSRALHWGMACMLIWQFVISLSWRIFGPSDLLRTIASLGPYHGTVGVLTIALVTIRTVWASVNRMRRPRREASRQGMIAQAVHVSFYFLMFTIPFLALLRAYGSGKGRVQWGVWIVPPTGEEIRWMIAPADALHGVLSWLLGILIVGHIAMAFHHHLIRRNRMLFRMIGPLRSSETE
ncbi:MAG: cytochrome b [Pseudochelatococcus sp.]|jgi:cytochrome b561|uniref:cytochrome b n=1 Tax=Pseudochelatococcus sp. TaxID=2020869 RepID=UPI003D8E38E7